MENIIENTTENAAKNIVGKIVEKRTSEYMAEQIADEILSGRIEGGYPLRQELLAENLGASRIPVREALQMLESQGLAVRLSTRHILAATITDIDIRECFSMFAEIEKRILQERRRKKIVIEGLEGLEFHKVLCQSAKNTYLQHVLQNAIQYYIRFALSISEDDDRVENLREELFSAIEVRDQERQDAIIEEYFNVLAENVIEGRQKPLKNENKEK